MQSRYGIASYSSICEFLQNSLWMDSQTGAVIYHLGTFVSFSYDDQPEKFWERPFWLPSWIVCLLIIKDLSHNFLSFIYPQWIHWKQLTKTDQCSCKQLKYSRTAKEQTMLKRQHNAHKRARTHTEWSSKQEIQTVFLKRITFRC